MLGPYTRYEPLPVDRIYGVSVDLLKICAQKLGFCYRLVYPLNTPFGSKLPNGTWTGLIGRLIKKEFEFAVPPFGYDDERAEVVDFSSSILVDPTTAVFKYPSFEPDVTGFVKPFTLLVWGCISAMILGMILVMWLFSFLNSKVQITRQLKRTSAYAQCEKDDESFGRTAMLITRAFLGQSLEDSGAGKKFLLGLWLCICFIIGTVYKSNLMSKMIAPKVNFPFTNIEEMLDNKVMEYAVSAGSILEKLARISPPNTLMRRLASGMVINNNAPELRKGIIEGKFAYLTFRVAQLNTLHYQFTMAGKCTSTMLKDSILPMNQALVFRKGSPWRNKIDPLIVRLNEFGIINKLIDDSIINAYRCTNPENQQQGLKPLQLEDFYGIFSMYLGGITLALAAFFAEVITGRKPKKLAAKAGRTGELRGDSGLDGTGRPNATRGPD